MEYMTVQEAAEKWGISLRLVQRLCVTGRIEGAQKFGSAWAIPAHADRPEDLRRAKQEPPIPSPVPAPSFSMMPLMNTPFRPGQCREAVEAMADGPRKDMAWAEYYYFSAQAERAAQVSEPYLNSPDLSLRLSACWIYGYANFTTGQIRKARRALETVQHTLAESEDQSPDLRAAVSAVMDYMRLRQLPQAQAHLLSAWTLARPDDLIEGFGEHHGLMGGMLESTFKENWPEDLRRILDVTYRFSWGWRRIHNPDTGHDVADNLTTTEFSVAMLTAQGWTSREIAAHMNVSPNTVKRQLAEIKKKLGISNRNELKKYMLQ